jgi:pre-rRNA-processing protein TSR3
MLLSNCESLLQFCAAAASILTEMAIIMQSFPPTIILRHQRENLKKCSLRGLEGRKDCHFVTYPQGIMPETTGYLLLAIDGTPLQKSDQDKGLLLLDATWRYAFVMQRFVDRESKLEKRSIPPGFVTAYPRRQTDCPDPEAGLASIEALYIAYLLLGRSTDGLLDRYYWREQFLELNNLTLQTLLT